MKVASCSLICKIRYVEKRIDFIEFYKVLTTDKMIIGLTGGSGSGKSTIADILKEYNMFIIDADEIAHNIIKKDNIAYNEITKLFGRNILDTSGEIERQKLGDIVFNDKKKLELLTNCTHKYIIIEIKEILKTNIENENIVIDAPLLIESKLNTIVDEVWAVYADIDIRIARIMKRDKLTLKQAENRIATQMSWEKLSSYADIIIYNNGDFKDITNQIQAILNRGD